MVGMTHAKELIALGLGVVIGAGTLWALERRRGKSSKKQQARQVVLTREYSVLEKKKDVDGTSKEGFVAIFEDIAAELVQDLEQYNLSGLVAKPLKRMLDYNIPGGKLNRGLTVVQTALQVRKSLGTMSKTEEMDLVRKASVLGWCIEWLQASFLVSDDLMDSSVTRRGHPCWYRVPDIGTIAVNDALILMTQVDVLLHKYFGEDCALFMELHRIMTETTYQTEMGQLLDLTTQPPQGPINLDLYTEERHEMIVKYKTAFYSFYAPIALGMIAAGVRDQASLDVALAICVKMGVYFQVQDDYLDCYGSEEVIGKIGTDIQDSKCSWLIVQALKSASVEQRKILLANYGKEDPKCIEAVKAVYKQLDLEGKYHAYEEAVYKDLVLMINRDVTTVPKDIYFALLAKIYKRSK